MREQNNRHNNPQKKERHSIHILSKKLLGQKQKGTKNQTNIPRQTRPKNRQHHHNHKNNNKNTTTTKNNSNHQNLRTTPTTHKNSKRHRTHKRTQTKLPRKPPRNTKHSIFPHPKRTTPIPLRTMEPKQHPPLHTNNFKPKNKRTISTANNRKQPSTLPITLAKTPLRKRLPILRHNLHLLLRNHKSICSMGIQPRPRKTPPNQPCNAIWPKQ